MATRTPILGEAGRVVHPEESPREVVLLRHGETHGYHDDVGLTDLGERQARDAARTLDLRLAGDARVRLVHAPTARGTATAMVLRDALVEARGAAVLCGDPEPDGRFDSLRFFHDGAARESSGVAAHRIAYRAPQPDDRQPDDRQPDDREPDWIAEYDRFDSDYGAASKLGGPIDRWMTATTRHFEPPQVVVYRAWAGIRDHAARAAPGTVTVVASHSALLRAVAAAAVGHDPGEPANLEAVRVRVAGELARVAYREHEVTVEVPSAAPPWLDASYLAR